MTEPPDKDRPDTGAEVGRWRVLLAASAVYDLDDVSPRVVPAIAELLYGPLADNPLGVGKPLHGELVGSYSARRGSYRVLCDVDESEHHVRVFRVSDRSSAYRRR